MTDTFDSEHSDELAAAVIREEQQRLIVGMVIRHDQEIQRLKDKFADLKQALN